ncbi:MAG: hypothetical protein KAI22_06225, partial [Gammaproteobacteria bacterium]|nr:hypothetical protein [Gammaproteobacteria bacterium]
DMDVILKRSMDGLERPQSDEPVYPAVVPQIQKQIFIRTAAKVVMLTNISNKSTDFCDESNNE